MRTYTTEQIAEIGRCHKSSVNRLMRAGKLGEVKKFGHANAIQAENQAAVLEMVNAAMKKHGFHRHSNGPKPAPVDETGTIILLMEYVKIPAQRREMLIKLAQKFTAEELKLLLEL